MISTHTNSRSLYLTRDIVLDICNTLYVQSEESLRAYDLTRDWAELGETQISHIDHRFSYISGMLATEQR